MSTQLILTYGITALMCSLCQGQGQDPPKVTITMTPTNFKDQITSSLVANCSVPPYNNTNQRLFTLTLQKSTARSINEFQKIAWISGIDTMIHTNLTNAGNAVFDGHTTLLGDTDHAHGYLTATWSHPNFQQAGIYVCVVEFYDITRGDRTNYTASQKVTDDHARLQDVLGKVTELEEKVTSLEKDLHSHHSGLEEFNRTVVLHSFHTTHGSYFLSRPFLRNSAFAESVCGLLDGHLAEMSQEEYNTVSLALTSFNQTSYLSPVSQVIIGVTDEIKEGFWRYRKHTHTAAEYLNWITPTKPAVNKGKNCVVLMGAEGWKMEDVPCYDNAPNVHFLCELEI